MTGFRALRDDMEAVDEQVTKTDWLRISSDLTDVSYEPKDEIFPEFRVTKAVLFVVSGTTASERTLADGSTPIARFFEPGHLCTNLDSFWLRENALERLFAITSVTGILIPHEIFEAEYLDGGPFGRYLRKKVMQTLIFDKSVLVAKTLTNSEMRMRFLETEYRNVVRDVPAMHLARFLGMTPQGFSRFQKNRQRVNSG
ncbi:MAG: hypothetical protein AAFR35_12495 [Pseudomonadota bacterium]